MVGRIRIRIQEFITEIHHGVRKLCTYLHYVTGCNCSEIALKQQQHIEIPLSVRPHLFRDAGHEKRREEQLKWSLAFRLYIGSFPCAQLPGPVHTARLGRMCFGVFSLGLYFVYSFVFLWFVCVSPSFYVSLGSWVISLIVFFCISVTNLNEPPRVLATSTIMWVSS